jgi:hypothetical protein
MDQFIKIVVIVLLALLVAAAAAQGWNGSEGSSVARTGPAAYSDPYQRPGIFFLRRPERVLAPAYSLAYPFVAIRFEQRGGYVVREFQPKDQRAETIYSARVHQANKMKGHGSKTGSPPNRRSNR